MLPALCGLIRPASVDYREWMPCRARQWRRNGYAVGNWSCRKSTRLYSALSREIMVTAFAVMKKLPSSALSSIRRYPFVLTVPIGLNPANQPAVPQAILGLQTDANGTTYADLEDNGGSTEAVALVAGSVAIDVAGRICVPTDQHGESRPQGVTCDIGAGAAGKMIE